jgi:hypothetical protein
MELSSRRSARFPCSGKRLDLPFVDDFRMVEA